MSGSTLDMGLGIRISSNGVYCTFSLDQAIKYISTFIVSDNKDEIIDKLLQEYKTMCTEGKLGILYSIQGASFQLKRCNMLNKLWED